jgi:hypothetical protein
VTTKRSGRTPTGVLDAEGLVDGLVGQVVDR